jgi:hypothetical protein
MPIRTQNRTRVDGPLDAYGVRVRFACVLTFACASTSTKKVVVDELKKGKNVRVRLDEYGVRVRF